MSLNPDVTAPHPLRHVVNPRHPLLRDWLNGPVRTSFWIGVGVTAGLVVTVPFLPWAITVTP